MNKLMKWVRTNGNLHLEVLVNGGWKHYKNCPYVVADAETSSNNGFATAQSCLRNGYKYIRVIEVADFLKHNKTLDLLNEIYKNLSEDLPVELNLEQIDSSHINSLLAVGNWLKIEFKTATLRQSLFMSGGLEIYRRVLEDKIYGSQSN